jgi:hypothetical protein
VAVVNLTYWGILSMIETAAHAGVDKILSRWEEIISSTLLLTLLCCLITAGTQMLVLPVFLAWRILQPGSFRRVIRHVPRPMDEDAP